ncbi:hypothetical protein [Fig virus A]|nr:hypothetical protein [Fig virus A]
MEVRLSRSEILISALLGLLCLVLLVTTLTYYVRARTLETRLRAVKNITAVDAAAWEEL